jgi:hypothetical protein
MGPGPENFMFVGFLQPPKKYPGKAWRIVKPPFRAAFFF